MSLHPLSCTDYLEAEMTVGAKDAGVSRVDLPALERFGFGQEAFCFVSVFFFFLRIQRDKFL